MTFKCVHNLAPDYPRELVAPYVPSRSLRSTNRLYLKIPRSKTKSLGCRAFSVAGPTIWNVLPEELRRIDNLDTFKTKLKTLYFVKAYSS
jgi:hypothetical protein